MTVKDITAMCKAGNVVQAYEMAKTGLSTSPQDVWAQRKMGWALYYMLKIDIEHKSDVDFFNHFEEFVSLDLLTVNADSLIFDSVLWRLAEFIKGIPKDNIGEIDRLFPLFNKYVFSPSKGYSFLLKSCLGFETWRQLVVFFEWWNLDNLLPEDYQQFKLANGRKVMSLAEQAYIAYSKALLRLGNKDKIREFLPKIEKLMEDYPDMMYPGYFCGKLMLAMGAAREDALNIVMSFVRKKQSDFWIWQLLSEIYKDDADICLACLLRAIHCKTQEEFLGKVRMRLVELYLSRNDYCRAKYHLDKVVRCYEQQGWHYPYNVLHWLKESWTQNVETDQSDGIDYKRITDKILLHGTQESIAVVTHVNAESKRAVIVYGKKKRVGIKLQKLKFKVSNGCLLKIYWLPAQKEEISIVEADLIRTEIPDCPYIKRIRSRVLKSDNKPFAFIEGERINCFISPVIVQKYHLNKGDEITALAVYDYNKKKEDWSWVCVSVEGILKR